MPPKATPAKPPTREELEGVLAALTLKDDYVLRDAHPRPGFGTLGQKITVDANMFQVNYNKAKNTSIAHYDVDIAAVVKTKDQKMPKPLAAKIWAQAIRDNQGAPDKKAFADSAFDLQKNIYTTSPFEMGPNGKKEIQVALPEQGRELDDSRRFKLTLQLANQVDLNAVMRFCKKEKQSVQEIETVLTAIQAVNILLRDNPAQRFTPIGARGRFFGMDGSVPISNGGLVARGFAQSFRPTESGFPAIQLDTAYTALIKPGPIMNVIPEILGLSGGGGGDRGGRGGRGGPRGGRGGPRGGGPGGPPGHAPVLNELSPDQIRRITKVLRQARFTLPYKQSERTFSIKSISRKPASDITFVMTGRDGAADQSIGLVQYFKQQFNITIQKPRLPCIVYGRNFMVPLELVVLCDFNRWPFTAMTGDQAADMIRVAAQKPMDRSAAIKQWRQKLDYGNLPKLKSWGLEVNPNMMRVDARVLPTPKVTYNQGKTLNCQFGGWNLKGVRFTRPAPSSLKSWSVISFDNRFQVGDMQQFIGFLVQTMKQYGVLVDNGQPPCITGNPQRLAEGLKEAARAAYMSAKADPQLIVVLMPRKDVAMYQSIKNIAAMGLKSFVTTQCLQTQKLRNDRGLDQYCANVAMKIQSKLGGVTHEVPVPQVFDKTTMMVGADVTHPPGGGNQASIAVTVAGLDGDNVRFEPGIRLQDPRTEIIADLENLMFNHMKTFEEKTKSPPQKIIFFRDGVSEGQYAEVCKKEVQAIRAAAARFGTGMYKPKITFVICAKRHNMRFFPIKAEDADRTGNLKPGTVVDSKVTHPFAFDFYLQAHAGLQGTARPTHYIVLADDNAFKADTMQMLCNHLCYSYARATRAVSIVPVAYYADIIATQCRYLAYIDDESDVATSLSGSTQQPGPTIDPFLIAKRFQNSPSRRFAWYM